MNTKFTRYCLEGEYDLALAWIRQTPGSNYENNYMFTMACREGRLEDVVWLIQNKSNIDVHAVNDRAFRHGCRMGHLSVAKWLLENYPDTDIRAVNHYAVRYSRQNGHLDVTEWLLYG